MPTYDYKCLKCGEVFELFQSIKAEPIKKHPGCEGKVKRLISAGAGIIFKGSGFYATDYKNKGPKPAESQSPSSSSQKKTETKTGSDKKTENIKKK